MQITVFDGSTTVKMAKRLKLLFQSSFSLSYTLTATVVVHSRVKISPYFRVKMKASFSVHCH